MPNGIRLARFIRSLPMAEGHSFANPDHCMDVATAVVGAAGHQADLRREQLNQLVAEFHELKRWPDRRVTRAHRALVKTGSKWIITFNYDRLLEEAAEVQGIVCESLSNVDVVRAAELVVQDEDPDRPLRIMHLHGVVDDPPSIVLDGTSYTKHGEDRRVAMFIAAALLKFNACFVGFGFDELYLLQELQSHSRPTPRHVLLTDEEGAVQMTSERAALSPAKHGVIVAAFPRGQWRVLDEVSEWLVPVPGEDLRRRRLADATSELYTPNRIIPYEPGSDRVQASWRIAFDLVDVFTEQDLAVHHRAVVRGAPGSGKTELLRRVGWLAPSYEEPVLVRLRETEFPLRGSATERLLTWVQLGGRFGDGPPDIDEEHLRTRPLHILIDGLDEVPSDLQTEVAETLREAADELPLHRFTVAARPVAALSSFAGDWEQFQVAPDASWRDEYLTHFSLTWEGLTDDAPALRDLNDLLELPFFIKAVVDLKLDGRLENFQSALELVQALVSRSLAVPELQEIQEHLRPWLRRAALEPHLVPEGSLSRQQLESVPLLPAPAPAQARVTLDRLVDRSLLEASGDSYRFVHRLLAEALIAELLLELPPAPSVIEFLAPVVGTGLSRVRRQWAVPVTLLLPRSAAWRDALRERDPLTVARAVPDAAAPRERKWAAETIWRTYKSWEIWIRDRDAGSVLLNAGEALGRLLRSGSLPDVTADVVAGLADPSRQTRSNAHEVLAHARHPDIAAHLRHTLRHDCDAVVRRQAATSAARLGLEALYPAVRDRALIAEDDVEGQTMGLALRRLAPRSEVPALIAHLSEKRFTYTGFLAKRVAELDDPVASLRALQAQVRADRAHRVADELVKLVAAIDPAVDAAVSLVGFIAAAEHIHTEPVRRCLATNPRAFLLGILEAVDTGAARAWRAVPFATYFETDLLRRYHAGGEMIRAAEFRDAARRASEDGETSSPEPVTTEGDVAVSTLARLLRDGSEAAVAELKYEAIPLEGEAARLSDDDAARLRDLVERSWPAAGLTSVVVRRSGTQWEVPPDARAILFYGPHVDLPLTPQRWVDVAGSTYLFTPQHEWLRRSWSPEALELLLAEDFGDEASRWQTVVVATPDPLPASLADALPRRIQAIDDEHAIGYIIDRLRSGGYRDALRALASHHESVEDRVRRALAALGDVEAQRVLLSALIEDFRTAEGIDSDDISWLQGVRDGSLLALLFEALPASYNHRPGALGFNNTMTPIHDAIRRVGGLDAVKRYDNLLAQHPRPWDGAQFVRIHRDEVLEDGLDLAASAHAPAFRRAVGLTH